jgi:hypothetical protein
VKDFGLSEKTFFDDRFRIEEQEQGHFHLHYRNLRLELRNLADLGLGWKGSLRIFVRKWKCLLSEKIFFLRRMFSIFLTPIKPHIGFSKEAGPFSLVIDEEKGITVDRTFWEVNSRWVHAYSCFWIALRDLRVLVHEKEGWRTHKIYNSPSFAYLEGDEKSYEDYCQFKDKLGINLANHSIEKYRALIKRMESDEEHNLLVINLKDEIIDGQHRACLMLKRFGPDHKVKVLRIFSQEEKWIKYKFWNYLRINFLSLATFGKKRQHYLRKCKSLREKL